ncbi:MAG: hypothetical protein NC206_09670 [Bacteroides sp.]|nr:hypothetical protein [Roseburia sp.]MCM1347337.1 hypothetical protein [Bacteroides sp.]MCM1421831.1 hypothetical protein [Bacteroides sp.]
MNLYVRYFDHETLARSVGEAMAFLETIREIKTDASVAGRIAAFLESNNAYPFRLKVSYNNYVLFLKTEAKSLDEFKRMEQMRREQRVERPAFVQPERKRSATDLLNEEREGWYEASLMFKRVVLIRDTNKFQYKDTRFKVRLKAHSGMDCYNRIVNHLRNRQDVDSRSQFPSAKSANFDFKFIESDKPQQNNEGKEEVSAVASLLSVKTDVKIQNDAEPIPTEFDNYSVPEAAFGNGDNEAQSAKE